MPLMQLSTLVLPAPLGPISASNSPFSTDSDTRSRTTRPPKARLSSTISRSAIPSPIAAVLLDAAVAAALSGARLAQVELLDVGMAAQALGVPVKHDAAVFQHVRVVDRLQGDDGALLDEHHSQRQRAADIEQTAHDAVDNDGRQAKRQLIDQQQLRLAGQRSCNRQH